MVTLTLFSRSLNPSPMGFGISTRVLQVWENSDVLDYDPEVKEKRVALTKALYG